MSSGGDKLAFFCQMCDEVIDTNICKVHGIDFVTIKKISASHATRRREQNEDQRIVTRSSSPAGQEQGLVLKDSPAFEAELPVVPGSAEAGSGLEPYATASQHVDLDPDSIEHTINYQSGAPAEDAAAYRGYRSRTAFSFSELMASPLAKLGLAAGAASLILLTALLALSGPEKTPTALYSEAEYHYARQEFGEAQRLYQQFLNEFPSNPLAPMVEEKLDRLDTQIATPGADDPEALQTLVLKANAAFQKGRYASPDSDNAVYHVRRALNLNAEYEPALLLRDKLVIVLDEAAQESLADADHTTAIGYYQSILKLKPDDRATIQSIQDILADMSRAAR